MSLLEFQRRMVADVLRPLTPDDTMQTLLSNGTSMELHAASYVKPNPRLSAFERLEIYNRQYWFRVLSAIAEDFPALESVLGTVRFDKLVRDYIAANPSQCFTLRNLGSSLPQWLAANPSYAGNRAQMAVDVARIEWAYIEAFDKLDLLPLGLDEIATLDADSRIQLQPHLQLLALDYPMDNLVIRVHKKHARTELSSQASSTSNHNGRKQAPRVARGQTWLAVHRHQLVVYYKRLSQEEYTLLTSLAAGSTLGVALEVAFANSALNPEEQTANVGAWFANWAELGWLCSPLQLAS